MNNTNWERVEELYTEILKEMADGFEVREGLKETPHRIVKYWKELLSGEKKSNEEIAMDNNVIFEVDNDDLVIEKDIEIFSTCEHHLALIYDAKVTIAYIPKLIDGKARVIGLSKLARIANECAHRLTLQEKIGRDILECLRLILNTEDIAVRIQAKHGCMTARGIRNSTAYTVTKATSGKFRTDTKLLQELE